MIVKHNKDGNIGIPVKGSTDVVSLPPSYSDVDDARWAACRENAMRMIKSGEITEEWVKVDLADVGDAVIQIESEIGTEKAKRLIPAKLKDIPRTGNKVINMVKTTFHPPTLTKWYESELRQDVRIELQKQIDAVNTGTIKG